jgi:hypothetical protein
MRTILIALVAGSALLAVGVGGTAQYFRNQLAAQAAELRAAQLKAQQAEATAAQAAPQLETARAQAARLESDYNRALAEADELRASLSRLESVKAATPAPVEEEENIDVALDDEPEPAPREDERDGRDNPERQAEREQRMAEFQAMADTFFADQIANATTEEARQRLEDIDAYRNQMFELRAAMRNAKTEEERAALEEQADAARDNLQQLTKEQQRAMLVDVGRNYGLKGEDLQAFQREMREVIESPFFRMGGPGGGGRGRGGPFGGGGPGR